MEKQTRDILNYLMSDPNIGVSLTEKEKENYMRYLNQMLQKGELAEFKNNPQSPQALKGMFYHE